MKEIATLPDSIRNLQSAFDQVVSAHQVASARRRAATIAGQSAVTTMRRVAKHLSESEPVLAAMLSTNAREIENSIDEL